MLFYASVSGATLRFRFWECPGGAPTLLSLRSFWSRNMAHPQARITKRLIDGMKPEDRDFYVFDTDVTGFGIRVRSTGAISYIVQ